MLYFIFKLKGQGQLTTGFARWTHSPLDSRPVNWVPYTVNGQV